MESKFTKTLNAKLRGMNLSQLSRELNIPSTLLFEWKQSKRSPSFKNLAHVKRLANYFGLSLEELLFGEETRELISSSTIEVENIKLRIKIEKIDSSEET